MIWINSLSFNYYIIYYYTIILFSSISFNNFVILSIYSFDTSIKSSFDNNGYNIIIYCIIINNNLFISSFCNSWSFVDKEYIFVKFIKQQIYIFLLISDSNVFNDKLCKHL